MSIENLKGFGETTLEIGRWPLSNVECFFLVSDPFADAATGEITEAQRSSEAQEILVPVVMAMFLFLVRVLGWPSRNGSFNVWVNLPLFDPTAGGDVLL